MHTDFQLRSSLHVLKKIGMLLHSRNDLKYYKF